MVRVIQGRPLVSGTVEGRSLMSTEPLSFWGGYDQKTGEIIDRRHPLSGETGSGRILGIPFTRGSSTTTAVLLESVRAGVAPCALLTSTDDPFLALASIVAGELYDLSFPVVVLDPEEFSSIPSPALLRIEEDGRVILENG